MTLQQHVLAELNSILAALLAGAKYGVKIRLPHSLLMTGLFRRDLDVRSMLKRIAKLVFEHASHLATFAATYKSVLALLKWTSRHAQALAARNSLEKEVWKRIGSMFIKILLFLIDGPSNQHFSLAKSSDINNNANIVNSSAPPGHPERVYHSLIAGAVGGYFVWGRYTAVNYQILLYLSSRVAIGLGNWTLRKLHGQFTTTQSASDSTLPALPYNKYYSIFAAITWAIVMALYEENPDLLHPSLTASMHEIYRPTRVW